MRTTIDLTAAADSRLRESDRRESGRLDFLLDDDRDEPNAEPPNGLAPSGDSNHALILERADDSQSPDSRNPDSSGPRGERPAGPGQSADTAETARPIGADPIGTNTGPLAQTGAALLATPPAPTIASITEDTGTPGDGITIDDDLLVSGTAQAGATVELFLDAVSLGTTAADATTGAWSIQTGTIAVGTYTLTATATDTGGTSLTSAGFAIEVAAPAPVIALSSLDGSDGFVLAGIDGFLGGGAIGVDSSGISVSGAGDVNGDGFDDLIVGTQFADGGPGNPALNAGESYVIFGRAAGFGSVLHLDALTADEGFLLAGTDASDQAGFWVSGAGDLDGDGFADLIVGAPNGDGGPLNPRAMPARATSSSARTSPGRWISRAMLRPTP